MHQSSQYRPENKCINARDNREPCKHTDITTHLKSAIYDNEEGLVDQIPHLGHLFGHFPAGFANFDEDSLHVGPHFCKLNLDLTNWIGNFVLQLQLDFLKCAYDELPWIVALMSLTCSCSYCGVGSG